MPEFLRPGRGRRRVLFICLGNACRSQMAEAFARAYVSDVMAPSSAGLLPSVAVSTSTRKVMRERGVPMEGQMPKTLDIINHSRYHLVVNLSGRPVPRRHGVKVVDWDVPDPLGKDLQSFRMTRDQIETLVRVLGEELRAGRAQAREERLFWRARSMWRHLKAAVLLAVCALGGICQAGPLYELASQTNGARPWEQVAWQYEPEWAFDAFAISANEDQEWRLEFDPDSLRLGLSAHASFADSVLADGFGSRRYGLGPPVPQNRPWPPGHPHDDDPSANPEPASVLLVLGGAGLLAAFRVFRRETLHRQPH